MWGAVGSMLGGVMGGGGGATSPVQSSAAANAFAGDGDFIVNRKPKQNPWPIVGALVAGAVVVVIWRRF